MASKQFMITTKKRCQIKPFLQIYEAKRKGDVCNNYFVQIYNLTKFDNQKIKEALEFNQCVFTDKYQNSTANILKIRKVEETQNFCALYTQKYDKNLQQYIRERKKGRVPQATCLKIMQEILKGLYTILQAGYRPVSIRCQNIVRCFSSNPQQRQQTWKIKNVIYTSNLIFQQQNFLTYQDKYSPPEIYSRRNSKDIHYQEGQDYGNALLVWSLGVVFAKLLGVENRLDSKRKLTEFRDRQFNIADILYIKNQYSEQFLNIVANMLHFHSGKRIKLKDLYQSKIFSQQLKQSSRSLQQNVEQKTLWKDISQSYCSLFQFKQVSP